MQGTIHIKLLVISCSLSERWQTQSLQSTSKAPSPLQARCADQQGQHPFKILSWYHYEPVLDQKCVLWYEHACHAQDGLSWSLKGRSVARMCLIQRGVLPVLAAPSPSGTTEFLTFRPSNNACLTTKA